MHEALSKKLTKVNIYALTPAIRMFHYIFKNMDGDQKIDEPQRLNKSRPSTPNQLTCSVPMYLICHQWNKLPY